MDSIDETIHKKDSQYEKDVSEMRAKHKSADG